MTHIKQVLIEFLKTMLDDLKNRTFSEPGQEYFTRQRIFKLEQLIKELEK